ncbi:nuclear transport factor 2 family protein [Nocardioides humi]|uniref:SnoaL-like domain-containing protein n=1 Tax=Nocardioides humi TaxID=449461 RepID=A0ABN1ZPG2_9ACTN|nr:nuclear transport factor 2 family protein [Nocardioides humi]
MLAEGAAAVEAFYRSLVRLYDDGTPRTRHITTNVTIEVDAEAGTATGAASYTVFQATDALPLQAIIVGRYRDTFRRIDGAWWFASRTMAADLSGDLSRHLLR